MGALARQTTGVFDLEAVERYRRSKLIPQDLANDAASAEYIMRIGEALGLPPVSAFQHIFVFPDGKRLKAGMSAHLMQALAIAAGHTVHVEGDAVRATATLVRKTTPEQLRQYQFMREEERRQKLALIEDTDRLYQMQRDQIRDQIADLKALVEAGGGTDIETRITELAKRLAQLGVTYNLDALRDEVSVTKFDLTKLARFESIWTYARAEKAQLTFKDVWNYFRPEMLKSRAKSSVVRDGAIEVILGIQNLMEGLGVTFAQDAADDEIAVSSVLYTPEELGADVNGDGVPLQGRVVNVTGEGVSRGQDRAIETGRTVLDKFPDDEKLAQWLTKQAAREDLSADLKKQNLAGIALAVEETARADNPVAEDVTLSGHLENLINSI